MTTPLPFQLEDVNKLIADFKGRGLLCWEMGLGKSYGALLAASKLESFPLIIVCPASIKFVWEEQAKRHFGLHSVILSGENPNKQLLSKVPITIINYDILKNWVPLLKDLNPK